MFTIRVRDFVKIDSDRAARPRQETTSGTPETSERQDHASNNATSDTTYEVFSDVKAQRNLNLNDLVNSSIFDEWSGDNSFAAAPCYIRSTYYASVSLTTRSGYLSNSSCSHLNDPFVRQFSVQTKRARGIS